MSTYKGIQGYTVQKLSSDPTASEVEGQLWYNSSSNTWKISANVTGAWAAGGALTRSNGKVNVNGAGSQTATIAAGGYSPSYYTYSESYNGSAWTATAALNAARYETGMGGTQTAAICIAGATETAPTLYETAACETWNGASWTSITDITTRRGTLAGCGTTTAALGAAGNYGTTQTPSWQFSVLTEEWNGASWTEVGDVNNARNYICQAAQGTVTAAVINGGTPLTLGYKTETYNGTAWTEVADSNTDREHGGGFGNSTSAIAMGGYSSGPVVTDKAESWNGLAWTQEAVMASAAIGPGGSGSGSAGIAIGGQDSPSGTLGTCEEWQGGILARTVTTS